MKARILFAVAAITALVINADLATAQILQGKSVLFVGGSPDPTQGDDGFVFDHLEDLGADVLYLAAADAITEDGEDVDLIILSSTPGSGNIRGKFTDLPTPILNWEEAIMRNAAGDLSMGAGSNNGGAFQGTQLEIINPAHPLAAGLSGIVEYAEVAVSPAHITGPAPGVISIAKLPSGQGGPPTYVTGNAAPVGNDKSIRLSGGGTTIDVPTIERPAGEFAYSFWFNADSATYGETFDINDPRVDFFYGDGNGGPVRPHLSANRTGRPIGIYVHDGAADVAEPIEALTEEFETDAWHHIVINFDGINGSVFVNGVLENEIDLGVDLGPSGTGMHIGTTQNNANPFIGLLDEVAIWDRSLSFEVDGADQLTGGEIATIFNSGIHSLQGLDATGYWPFDDQSDPTIAVDESGNENTGLLPGAVTSGEIAISAVGPGGELVNGTEAPGRRVNFPIVDTGFSVLTDDGIALFDAALAWLVGDPTPSVPGDYNRDGVVDAADADAQSTAMKSPTPDLATFDEDNDGEVDGADRLIWVKTHAVEGNGTWVGDANLDGEFNSGDLVEVFAAGKYEQVGAMAGWAEGDWDGDMLFDSGDLVAAFSDGGYEQGPFMAAAAVPEPSSIALVLLGTSLMVLRRRRM